MSRFRHAEATELEEPGSRSKNQWLIQSVQVSMSCGHEVYESKDIVVSLTAFVSKHFRNSVFS